MKNKKWKKEEIANGAYAWEYSDKKSGFVFLILFDSRTNTKNPDIVEVSSWFKGSDEDFYIKTFKIKDRICSIKDFERQYLDMYQQKLLDATREKLAKIIESF